MPALQERSIRVKLSKEKRKGKKEQLRSASRGRKKLREIGKALMAVSLQTSSKRVDEYMQSCEDCLSEDLDDRPRYSYQVCLTGIKFLRDVVEKELNLEKSAAKLNEMVDTLEDHYANIGADVADVNARSEVDAVMEELHIMASMPRGNDSWLTRGIHYVVVEEDTVLVIDPMLCHALYKTYIRSVSMSGAVIESARAFLDLIKEEPYFIEFQSATGMASGRKVAWLDRAKMLQKGVDSTNFT
jgi:hypothetical protein